MAWPCSVPGAVGGGYGSKISFSGDDPWMISDAIAYWTTCANYGFGFPALSLDTSAAVQVAVVVESSASQDGLCGEAAYLGSNTFRIRVWPSSVPQLVCNMTDTLAHEIGHVLGLMHGVCGDGSIMEPPPITWINGIAYAQPRSVLDSDCELADQRWATRWETGASPMPPGTVDASITEPCGGRCSPIVFDLDQRGFEFCGSNDAVYFDIDGDRDLDILTWTERGREIGFLWLDRNHNGQADGGTELFGDASPQPPSLAPNGFRALSLFDSPREGGNGDGRISRHDRVFKDLRFWIDRDHDAHVDTGEVQTLVQSGVTWIDLDYRDGRRIDEHGNILRWVSRAGMADGSIRRIIDVIFVGAAPEESTER